MTFSYFVFKMEPEQNYPDGDHVGSQGSWQVVDYWCEDDLIQLSPRRTPSPDGRREGDSERRRSRDVGLGLGAGRVFPDEVRSREAQGSGEEVRAFSPRNPFRRRCCRQIGVGGGRLRCPRRC